MDPAKCWLSLHGFYIIYAYIYFLIDVDRLVPLVLGYPKIHLKDKCIITLLLMISYNFIGLVVR